MDLFSTEAIDWSEMFSLGTPLLEIFIRGTAVYLLLFLILRVVLKRESATLGVTDLLVVVLLADAAQNAMADDYNSITDGILLVMVIIFWSHFLDFLGYKFPFFQRLIKPQKLLLVKNGKMYKKNMRKELITIDELMAEVRLNGVKTLDEVDEAYMESSGEISVISKINKSGVQNSSKRKSVF